jgi:ribosome maturation factor RimP
MAPAQQALRAVIAPVVESMGYDLDDLSVAPAGRRRLVRVVIDADDGVTLDGAAEVSRAVSSALDADGSAVGGGSYVLEVTSRGVDRPLTLPRHWRRNIGRLVMVEPVADAAGAASTIRGRVSAADDDAATLDVDGEIITFAYPAIRRALVQVELNPHN